MTELTILGLVDVLPKLGSEDVEIYGEGRKIRLKSEFTQWLRTDEFKELRGGFVPDSTDIDTEEEPD